jgi:hypothetical protein
MIVTESTSWLVIGSWVLFGAAVGALVGLVARLLGSQWRHVAYAAALGVAGCFGGLLFTTEFEPWIETGYQTAIRLLGPLRPIFPENPTAAALLGAIVFSTVGSIVARLSTVDVRGQRA